MSWAAFDLRNGAQADLDASSSQLRRPWRERIYQALGNARCSRLEHHHIFVFKNQHVSQHPHLNLLASAFACSRTTTLCFVSRPPLLLSRRETCSFSTPPRSIHRARFVRWCRLHSALTHTTFGPHVVSSTRPHAQPMFSQNTPKANVHKASLESSFIVVLALALLPAPQRERPTCTRCRPWPPPLRALLRLHGASRRPRLARRACAWH